MSYTNSFKKIVDFIHFILVSLIASMIILGHYRYDTYKLNIISISFILFAICSIFYSFSSLFEENKQKRAILQKKSLIFLFISCYLFTFPNFIFCLLGFCIHSHCPDLGYLPLLFYIITVIILQGLQDK